MHVDFKFINKVHSLSYTYAQKPCKMKNRFKLVNGVHIVSRKSSKVKGSPLGHMLTLFRLPICEIFYKCISGVKPLTLVERLN